MKMGRPRLRDISFTVTLPREYFEWLVEECKRRDPEFNPRSHRPRPTRRISYELADLIYYARLDRLLTIKHTTPPRPRVPKCCSRDMEDFGESFYCFSCDRKIEKSTIERSHAGDFYRG